MSPIESLDFCHLACHEQPDCKTTIEPSNDHPKCEDLVVAYGKWSPKRIALMGGLF